MATRRLHFARMLGQPGGGGGTAFSVVCRAAINHGLTKRNFVGAEGGVEWSAAADWLAQQCKRPLKEFAREIANCAR